MAKKKREEKTEGEISRLLISFGYSRSPNYAEAVQVARSLPGYGRRGSGKAVRHTVEQELHLADEEGLATVRYLHRLVESWKGSRVELSGCQEKHFRQAEHALEVVSRCYEQQKSSGLGDEYCSGREESSDEPIAFGCRRVTPVVPGAGVLRPDQRGWYEFGKLTDDGSAFCVDHEAIRVRMQADTSRWCRQCRAFSQERIDSEVGKFPESVPLGDETPFEIKRAADGSAVGIQPRLPRWSITVGATTKKSEPEPDESPSRNIPSVRYDQVAGQDAVVAAVREAVELPLKHGDYFQAVGISRPTGIVLYGPPGNGKTLLAKAVATECEAHLEVIAGPGLLSLCGVTAIF